MITPVTGKNSTSLFQQSVTKFILFMKFNATYRCISKKLYNH